MGSVVYLLPDKEDKDQYSRFLRYVWDAEGEFYNNKAVSLGYAKAVLYPPNDRFIDEMRAAEREAKDARRGLWGACAIPSPVPQTSSKPPASQAPTTQPSAPTGNCHASYPDLCIPPSPPELDCKDVPYRDFRVRHDVPDPDPHAFDGKDNDGLGCESR